MSLSKDNNTGKKAGIPNLSELFGDAATLEPNEHDVFGGDLSLIRNDTRQQAQRPFVPQAMPVYQGSKLSHFFQFFLVVNLVVLTGILIYLVRRPAVAAAVPTPVSAEATAPNAVTPARQQSEEGVDPAALIQKMALGRATAEALDGAISLQTAAAYYAAQEYTKAAYVYERLRRNLTTRTFQDEALADWLTLQMALCLQKSQEQELMGDLFARAMNSRSVVVRAMTHYNLAFIHIHNRSFLEARRHAYQALALLKTVEDHLPMTVEADCYFLAAEALTRYLLSVHNRGDALPGVLWSDGQPIHSLPDQDQLELSVLLARGADTLNRAVTAPLIQFDPHRSVGIQWSAYALDGPLDQLLWQYASEARVNLNLSSLTAGVRRRKTTVFLPQVDRNYLVEVAAGSAGLVWRFDGQAGLLYDPLSFEDSDSLKTTMAQEGIAMWQRFLLRYRGDHRSPNAHYCLGQLYTAMDQAPAALGDYKLLAAQYPNNPLAPYALLGSSRIKTHLRDYTGAEADLNELLIRYPNSKIMDEAMLSLAEATMDKGNYSDAAEMFRRVYYLDVSAAARQRSSYGLGKCAFEQGRYKDTIEWLAQSVSLTADKNDQRLPSACYMLGKAYIETGDYAAAAQSLSMAITTKLSDSDYVKIILELVVTETRQERYLSALNILQSIPESRLNQSDSVAVMLAQSQIYRQIDLPTTAISLLRRRVPFIAESRLRARLSLELAECYLHNGEFGPARLELDDAMRHLPPGRDSHRAAFLLARIAYLNKNHEQAVALCREALNLDIQDVSVRRDFYDLLGAIYTEQKAFDRAALAYAGIPEKTDTP